LKLFCNNSRIKLEINLIKSKSSKNYLNILTWTNQIKNELKIKNDYGDFVEDSIEISNIFNIYFISVFDKCYNPICNYDKNSKNINIFDKKFIKTILLSLKNKNYRKPNGVSLKFYNMLSTELCPIITHMFNLFYNYCYISSK
jgi:hypothetical protein